MERETQDLHNLPAFYTRSRVGIQSVSVVRRSKRPEPIIQHRLPTMLMDLYSHLNCCSQGLSREQWVAHRAGSDSTSCCRSETPWSRPQILAEDRQKVNVCRAPHQGLHDRYIDSTIDHSLLPFQLLQEREHDRRHHHKLGVHHSGTA